MPENFPIKSTNHHSETGATTNIWQKNLKLKIKSNSNNVGLDKTFQGTTSPWTTEIKIEREPVLWMPSHILECYSPKLLTTASPCCSHHWILGYRKTTKDHPKSWRRVLDDSWMGTTFKIKVARFQPWPAHHEWCWAHLAAHPIYCLEGALQHLFKNMSRSRHRKTVQWKVKTC